MAVGAPRVCLNCGTVYTPNIQPSGRIPRDYKQCPQCGSTNTALPLELKSRFKKKRLKNSGGSVGKTALGRSHKIQCRNRSHCHTNYSDQLGCIDLAAAKLAIR